MIKKLLNTSDHLATDPTQSVWVSASAGTGKTYILTQRLLRLLLSGIPPSRILCLTFTKAAAAEMLIRLRQELMHWVAVSESELQARLAALLGCAPTPDQCHYARQLFAMILDDPEGLAIQTIHAFSQEILQRFPIEAGIAPHFRLIDTHEMNLILRENWKQLLTHSEAYPTFAKAVATLVSMNHDTQLMQWISEVVYEREAIQRYLKKYDSLEVAIFAIYQHLGLEEIVTPEMVIEKACQPPLEWEQQLRAAIACLQEGTVTDQKRAYALAEWLASTLVERLHSWESYVDIFMTQQGTPRAQLATKKIAENSPKQVAFLYEEQQRLSTIIEKKNAAHTANLTEAIFIIGTVILQLYEEEKRQQGVLDFQDLIMRTSALLSSATLQAWVLYKLDKEIDHVLIDEAQDTSPLQWHIIQAITQEFFAGEGQHTFSRTLFVVGDEKQSIFSFQGADPLRFLAMRNAYFEQLHSQGSFHLLPRTQSFRSNRVILNLVDQVLKHASLREAMHAKEEVLQHHPYRKEALGYIELWPLVSVAEAETEMVQEWTLPLSYQTSSSSSSLLAEQIGDTIATWLTENVMLASKQRPIEAGDILILVRKRDQFLHEIVRALKHRHIAVAGIDRMILNQQLAIKDLIALGQFLLLPEDDLTLAIVLKTPLIGLSEEALFTLAAERGEQSLWQQLAEFSQKEPLYQKAFEYLSCVLAQSESATPYQLYASILELQSGRKHIVERLGIEAHELLDEFLELAMEYQEEHAPSLQGFLHWLTEEAVELHRDPSQAPQMVRIMTVHGSKGLQAPIVFMPDTTQVPQFQGKLLWDQGIPLCMTSRHTLPKSMHPLIEVEEKEIMKEYYRLLYVALTRAEDILIIAGWRTKKSYDSRCWYQRIEEAFHELLKEKKDDSLLVVNQEGKIRLQIGEEIRAPLLERAPSEAIAPSLFLSPPEAETSELSYDAYLRLQDDFISEKEAFVSPLGEIDQAENFWNKNIYPLLEKLSLLPPLMRRSAALNYLKRFYGKASEEAQHAFIQQLLNLMEAPATAWIFESKKYLVNLPVEGTTEINGKSYRVSGHIDRLVWQKHQLFIVKFKTDISLPTKKEEIPSEYLQELGLYQKLLKPLYPGMQLRGALVWVHHASWMEIGEGEM